MQRGHQRGLRGTAARIAVLFTVVLMAVAAILPAVARADSPYSTVSPATDQANEIHDIYKLTFWLALIVFVGVQIGIAYTVCGTGGGPMRRNAPSRCTVTRRWRSSGRSSRQSCCW